MLGSEFQNAMSDVLAKLTPVLLALLVLLIGWVFSMIISRLVRAGLAKCGIDRFSEGLPGTAGAEGEAGAVKPLSHRIAQVVHILLMIMVALGVLYALREVIGLSDVENPLAEFMREVTKSLPSLVVAMVLALIAWALATAARTVVVVVASKYITTERLEQLQMREGEEAEDARERLPRTLGGIAYVLVILVFLPEILNRLNIQTLSAPMQQLGSDLAAKVPDLLGAAFIILIGVLVSRIVGPLVTSMLQQTTLDSAIARVQQKEVSELPPEQRPSVGLGRVAAGAVIFLALLPALPKLGLEELSQPLQEQFGRFVDLVPNIILAITFILVGWFGGRLLASVVTGLLAGIGFDGWIARAGLWRPGEAGKDRRTPSRLLGDLSQVVVILLASLQALELVQLQGLAAVVRELVNYLPGLLTGLVLVGVGVWLANWAAQAVQDAPGLGTAYRTVLANLARVAILVIAGGMALTQMDVAAAFVTAFVTGALNIVLGTIGLGLAIAIGLGARPLVEEYLRDWQASRAAAEAGEEEPAAEESAPAPAAVEEAPEEEPPPADGLSEAPAD